MKKRSLETLEIQSKKKKNFLIVGGILVFFGIILFSMISNLLEVKKEKTFKDRQLSDEISVIENPEYKENWAIAIENRIKKQSEQIEKMEELSKAKQDSMLVELKEIINQNNEDLKSQLALMKETEASKSEELKLSLFEKINEQNDRIKQMENLAKEKDVKLYVTEDNVGEDLVIGKDMLPVKNSIGDKIAKKAESILDGLLKDPNTPADLQKIDDVVELKSEALKPIGEKKGMKIVSINTDLNQKIIKVQETIMKEGTVEEEETKFSPYHVSTGFMKAYMITGAYAPAFQEGSMEPLPVLFEAEGDLLMANNTTGTLDKCFLLGSAKGNMNSQTADIKLVTINCLINGGEHRVEGTISGWVIGESGSPGLQGEMIHKNGAWLARTFISGFFETFAGALNGSAEPQTFAVDTTGTTNNNQAMGSNFAYAGAQGISSVFSKLGEYYLKMAEQIFPIIEVKGGRTVNILLIGGEELTVVDNKLVSTTDMAETSATVLKTKKKKSKIVSRNAFKEVILNDSPSMMEQGKEVINNGAEKLGIPSPLGDMK